MSMMEIFEAEGVPEYDAPTFDNLVARAISLEPVKRPAAKDRVLARLALDKKLTGGALAVALALLMDFMWAKGVTDRLGFADLMQRTGYRSRETIKRAVELLEERGHVVVHRSPASAKVNDINRYVFPHFFS